MPFTSYQRVRFSDTDAMGHVNNARFLTYLEDARLEMFLALPTALVAGGLIVARVECDYVRPIVVDRDPLAVDVWVADVGRSSFTLGSTIRQRGEVAARARTVIVAFDYAAHRSRPLTEAERAGLDTVRAENPSPDEPGQA